MYKLGFILATLGTIMHQPALGQSSEVTNPPRIAMPPKSDDGQSQAIFKNTGVSDEGSEAAPTTSKIQRAPSQAIPKCYAIGSTDTPSVSANWASYHTGIVGKDRLSLYVDTTTIKHCKSGDDVMVRFWEKIDFTDKSYKLSSEEYNCSQRKQGASSKSWIYLKDGRIVEIHSYKDLGNPIPISSAYNLVRYLCNTKLDRSLSEIPAQALIWVQIDQTDREVSWAILEGDITRKPKYDGFVAEFWLKKDYSNAKWTKYRYSYSYDQIDCTDARYSAGQSYAFLPNQQQGEPIYEDTMRNIAPGSVQAALMNKVCGFR